eukprot:5326546-Lingulodinium_polyedra.AAC.1
MPRPAGRDASRPKRPEGFPAPYHGTTWGPLLELLAWRFSHARAQSKLVRACAQHPPGPGAWVSGPQPP